MGKRSAFFTLRLLSEGTDLGGSLLQGKSNLPQRYPHHAMIHRQTVHTCTFAFALRRRGDGAVMPCRHSPRHFVLWTGGFLGAAFRAMSRCSRAPLSLSSSPSPPTGQPSPSSTRRPPFARSHLAWCSIGVGSRSRAAQIGTAGIAGVRGFRAARWPHARPCLRCSLPPLPLAARLMPAFLIGSSLAWGRGGMLLHG